MSEVPTGDGIARSELMSIPLLTLDEINALHERADHGINPVEMVRFGTFEDWRARVSNSTWGLGFFLDIDMYRGYKELQCIQRYIELYPEEAEEVRKKVNAMTEKSPPEDVDRLIWGAYEKFSKLVDINDEVLERQDDESISPRALLI